VSKVTEWRVWKTSFLEPVILSLSPTQNSKWRQLIQVLEPSCRNTRFYHGALNSLRTDGFTAHSKSLVSRFRWSRRKVPLVFVFARSHFASAETYHFLLYTVLNNDVFLPAKLLYSTWIDDLLSDEMCVIEAFHCGFVSDDDHCFYIVFFRTDK
jgi:hypothetical protein